jgi:hypothetical protein
MVQVRDGKLTDKCSPGSLEHYIDYASIGGEEKVRITVNRCEELICFSIGMLVHRHSQFTSQAAVMRFLTAFGISKIQKLKGIKEQKKLKEKLWEVEDEKKRLLAQRRLYDFNFRISYTNKKLTVCCCEWVSAQIRDISFALGLPLETITKLSLIFALSYSEKLIPSKHVQTMKKEVEKFKEFVRKL